MAIGWMQLPGRPCEQKSVQGGISLYWKEGLILPCWGLNSKVWNLLFPFSKQLDFLQTFYSNVRQGGTTTSIFYVK